MKRILPLILILSLSCQKAELTRIEQEFMRLDQTLEIADRYVEVKENTISTIENMLNSRGVSDLQKYKIYDELYKESIAFQFDKAKSALDNQIDIAKNLKDCSLLQDAYINKARLLTSAGFYHEAQELFNQIDTTSLNRSQMNVWYMARQKFLTDYQEYLSSSNIEVIDAHKITYYQNKILEYIPKDSYYNKHIEILRLISENQYDKAKELNTNLLNTLDSLSRDYAVQTYWQGFIFNALGDYNEAVHWWIESAICDIKGAIKDNASLTSIAINLVDSNDADRAFRYMRVAFDDAAFYNSKLRRVQMATAFPAIEKAYATNKSKHESESRKFTIFISVASLLLLLLLALAIMLYIRARLVAKDVAKKSAELLIHTKSLEQAQEAQRKTNLELTEANAAKEEYLGLYLSMCSRYIDKLRKTITTEQYEAEVKNFYKTFDTSFIQLYPNFVEDFNALLQKEHRLYPKEGELLNTELRIFALIKLGITQSSHIASLLRYSVNTIYNYRAQVKNTALENRENFEDLVRKIGSQN